MRTATFFLSLMTALVFTGCASVKVDTEYDETADFASYETFSWMQQPDQVQDHLTQMGRITQQIEQAIEQELVADGYRKTEDTPDFFVVYHTALERQITGATIDTWGYGYRRPALRRGDVVIADVDVHTYQEGTLIIDIVDAARNELVWRGSVVGAVNSPRDAAQKIDEAVQKILSEFPPQADL